MTNPPSWVAQSAKMDRRAKSKRVGPTPETVSRRLIVTYLKRSGLDLQQVAVQKVGAAQYGDRTVYYGQRGMSDLRVDLKGTPIQVFIEVKELGHLEPRNAKERRHWEEQHAYLEARRSSGHVAFMADSPMVVFQELTKAGYQVANPWAVMRAMLLHAGMKEAA